MKELNYISDDQILHEAEMEMARHYPDIERLEKEKVVRERLIKKYPDREEWIKSLKIKLHITAFKRAR